MLSGLPRARRRLPLVIEVESRESVILDRRETGNGDPVATTLLIVDDSRIARRMARMALPEDWDVDIIEAGGGREAIEILETGDIEVMLLDLTMPEVDGYGVLAWLKEQAHLNPVVIVVSGDFQPLAGARVMNLGAFDFVKKPATKERISEALKLAGVL